MDKASGRTGLSYAAGIDQSVQPFRNNQVVASIQTQVFYLFISNQSNDCLPNLGTCYLPS